MTETEQALNSALSDVSAENLRLHKALSSVDTELRALRKLLFDINTRLAESTTSLVTRSRNSASASARALSEAETSNQPAVINAAMRANEAALVALGGVAELQNCRQWAMETTRATLAASTQGSA